MAIGFRTSGMIGRMSPMRSPMGTPGYGDGIMQRQAEMEPMNANPNAMPIGVKEMTKKPGFFQQGGFGQYALAALSDFGARLNDRDQSMLGDMMAFEQRNQMLAENARLDAMQSQQQRGNEWQDWLRKEQWKRENPEPQNDQLTQYMLNAGIDPKSPEAQQMYRRAVENKVNPPVWRQGADGNFYRVDTPQATAPVTDDEWNSASPMGGSGGNVTGGFR
jgi:hypothetical protein